MDYKCRIRLSCWRRESGELDVLCPQILYQEISSNVYISRIVGLLKGQWTMHQPLDGKRNLFFKDGNNEATMRRQWGVDNESIVRQQLCAESDRVDSEVTMNGWLWLEDSEAARTRWKKNLIKICIIVLFNHMSYLFSFFSILNHKWNKIASSKIWGWPPRFRRDV